MTARKLVNRCLSEGPEEVFRELGFLRDGLVFRRNVGEVHDVAQFQLRDPSFASGARFVLNVGAYHPKVHRALGDPMLAAPVPGSCTVGGRVNRGDQTEDLWWKVTPGHEAIVGGRVASQLRLYLEPWFKLANDLPALNDVTPHFRIYFHDSLAPAAIAVVLGQPLRAQARLAEVVKGIHDLRNHRAERYRKHDPFGTIVLKKAHFMTTGKRTNRFDFDEDAWLQVLNS